MCISEQVSTNIISEDAVAGSWIGSCQCEEVGAVHLVWVLQDIH